MRIAIVGPAHFGIAEPFAGGLEAHTASLAVGLLQLGHDVTVFAGDDAAQRPAGIDVRPILGDPLDFSRSDRSDNAMVPGRCLAEDDAYRALLAALDGTAFDVVHNNSLHYLLPGLAHLLEVPVVHTLHTPPFDWLWDAHRRRCSSGHAVVAVSRSLARQWRGVATHVIGNGVHVRPPAHVPKLRDRAVWVGRIVPEKAPHLAIDAARRAGFAIDLVGPVHHNAYFCSEVEPRLGRDAQWHGHLDQRRIRSLIERATVGVVTPRWEEPFGLTTAEMAANGTPVAAFDRGATREIVTPLTGRLARPDDVAGLADAIVEAAELRAADCLAHASRCLSVEEMVRRYDALYAEVIGGATIRDGVPARSEVSSPHVVRPGQNR